MNEINKYLEKKAITPKKIERKFKRLGLIPDVSDKERELWLIRAIKENKVFS